MTLWAPSTCSKDANQSHHPHHRSTTGICTAGCRNFRRPTSWPVCHTWRVVLAESWNCPCSELGYRSYDGSPNARSHSFRPPRQLAIGHGHWCPSRFATCTNLEFTSNECRPTLPACRSKVEISSDVYCIHSRIWSPLCSRKKRDWRGISSSYSATSICPTAFSTINPKYRTDSLHPWSSAWTWSPPWQAAGTYPCPSA